MSLYSKITVATASIASAPLLKQLATDRRLAQVILPQTHAILEESVRQNAPGVPITYATRPQELGISADADLLLVMGYPQKIDTPLNLTAFNIHFGPLPENRGPDPVFWTIRKGKPIAYVAIHELSNHLDAGKVLKEKGFDILPGESYGMLMNRLSMLSVPTILEVLEGKVTPRDQNETKAVYNPVPSEDDLAVKWNVMNAQEIIQLVNACNPKYGGARAYILDHPLHILEVSIADVDLPPDQSPPIPGMIVHASPEQGIFVTCHGQSYIRLNMISMPEGFFSGQRLAGMGTKAGTVLT